MDFYLILIYILAYIGLFSTSFYIINLFTYYRKKKKPEPATDKTVSIIIPAYNEEKSIAKTIKSALSINYPKNKFEIIVVDDGSKDNSYQIAKRFASNQNPKVKVFKKDINGGKGSALNLGIKKARGEIIITMDADTIVHPDSLKKMVGYFTEGDIMSVAPAMGVFEPKNIWRRIQQIEYYMGVFLRKSFASMNAIHITPGAFSAYRKVFFEKHGGFDEKNITEDLEVALRIQSLDYRLENAEEAAVYTIGPGTFRSLMVQRRRWYTGLMKNLWDYRRLFGPKTGALGTVVLPTAISTIFLSVTLTIYVVIKALAKIKKELLELNAINFQFQNTFEISSYMIEVFLLTMLSSKLLLLTILFIALLWFYMIFSRRKMMYRGSIRLNFILFTFFFSFLFAFWWIVSTIYIVFNKKVVWREE
ncbi:glycosyltransferase family 2 protein [Candidatus Pacearchaeota archaeon]|nr:glycosyltransferase family 2 protein [Candidatus Pacearchaeota archaeon]